MMVSEHKADVRQISLDCQECHGTITCCSNSISKMGGVWFYASSSSNTEQEGSYINLPYFMT